MLLEVLGIPIKGRRVLGYISLLEQPAVAFDDVSNKLLLIGSLDALLHELHDLV